jgi:hypothetical protein
MKIINENDLKKYYYNDKLTLVEIANKFGVCKQTIQRKIKFSGLPLREKLLNIEELTGLKINKLTFLKYVKNDKFGKALWLCKCECGKEKILNASAIKAGLTTSCGCNKRASLSKGHGDISGAFWRKLERSALSRNIEFEITIMEAWEIYLKQNKKCAISNVNLVMYPNNDRSRIQTASPDRIDSSKGYTNENFQWVHKRINRIKNILSTDELMFWVNKIHENNKNYTINEFDVNKLTWD